MASHGSRAVLYQEGHSLQTFSLQQNQTVPFGHFTIEVKKGSIGIIESDCPQKICVHTGMISNPAQTIVCVPNRVIIEIIADRPRKLNAVSY